MLDALVFYTLAALILGFGALVVTARNTVHSVLFLVANFLCIAVLYVMLAAEFLAVIQVLVYVGGIVVLYLFVVMLVNLKQSTESPLDSRRRSWLGFGVAGALLGEIALVLFSAEGREAPIPPMSAEGGNTEAVGRLLYLEYLIPFEIASMLLLAAMVGAIVLARREPREPETR
jgi:NADH-quinone oxidoreductase subunit J